MIPDCQYFYDIFNTVFGGSVLRLIDHAYKSRNIKFTGNMKAKVALRPDILEMYK